ncbi:MAG: alpha-L-arabinofuranosidase C-terminal domain-containing protein [Verrucomicrobiota bacterium]
MPMKFNLEKLSALLLGAALSFPAAGRAQNSATITVQAGGPGTSISPDLIGIFFEDINYAADGGLYAELVQNRSFEYNATEGRGWHALTAWELVERGGKGAVTTSAASPLHPNNPHYAVLTVENPGDGVGLVNAGFDGIPVRRGDAYDFAVFARQTAGAASGLTVRLEGKTGQLYAEARLPRLNSQWARCSATLAATADDADARLVVLADAPGTFCLDTVSLFPQKTFHQRSNGLRADLAQVVADLQPKFMRFPGGCLAHGYGLTNIYRWKDTIGPIEQRREQRNIWRYHQSVGLGYFEYFQFCEDIGAKPLPVQAAGVCCQNSPGGQHGVPMENMGEVIQDMLDLIEYANGPTNSTWGAKRAAAGHPAPFHLEYLGVGNEDAQTPAFGVRFKMIHEAIKARHPEITVIGTVGPFHSGFDFAEGWKFARELRLDMVDEHYYESPEWFLNNLRRYDNYDRAGTKVYLGEYASRGNALLNAIAEAAYLTSLERNADVVRMASYAPLLARERHTQWNPNLIYFNNTTVVPTVNYYVQQLFGRNQGDVYLPTSVAGSMPGQKRGFLLGSWDTQVEFKDVKVVSAGQTLLEEQFQSATNWNTTAGRWRASQGVFAQTDGGQPTLAFLKTTIDQPDYTLTLKARKTGGQEGFLIGFNAQDDRNYCWWNLGGWDNTHHAVEKQTAGAKATLGGTVNGSIELNRWYDIKIEVAGGAVKCSLNGALIHSLTNAAPGGSAGVAASCVKDSTSGEVILKLVNVTGAATPAAINLEGISEIEPLATRTVLAGSPRAQNTFQSPTTVMPITTECRVMPQFNTELPAHSLTVIRMKTRKPSPKAGGSNP